VCEKTSGIEFADRPGRARSGAAINEAIVQTVEAVLPELDLQRADAEARPAIRTRDNVVTFESGGGFRDLGFQLGAVL